MVLHRQTQCFSATHSMQSWWQCTSLLAAMPRNILFQGQTKSPEVLVSKTHIFGEPCWKLLWTIAVWTPQLGGLCFLRNINMDCGSNSETEYFNMCTGQVNNRHTLVKCKTLHTLILIKIITDEPSKNIPSNNCITVVTYFQGKSLSNFHFSVVFQVVSVSTIRRSFRLQKAN